MSKDLINQRQENATLADDPKLETVAKDVALNDEAKNDSSLVAEPFSAIDDGKSSNDEQVTVLGSATATSEAAEVVSTMSFAADDEHNLNGDDPDRVPVVPELPDDQVPNMPGAILKHAREMLGLSQREVVERLNKESQRSNEPSERIVIRVNTISDIEHDRLNQPTAVSFVVKIIKLYANLVNIDPKALTDLYMQNVSQSQKTADINAQRISREQRHSGSTLKKIVLLSAGGIVILGLGIGIGAMFSSSSEEESTSGALTLSQNVQQDMAQNNVAADPFPPAADDAEVPLDPNTEMARAQAQALGTNDIIANAHKTEVEKNSEPLNTNGTLSVDTPSKLKQEGAPADNNLSAMLTAPEVKTHDAVAANAEHVTDGGLPTAKPINALEERKADERKANVAMQNAKTKQSDKSQAQKSKPDKIKEPESKDTQATALAASVRDVSGSVRIVNRNDIGSLNTVTVKVKGPVSLRIKGNGKVLKSGSYKAGDTVSATGMPPLRIEVSDSSKISVRYNGGTASAPSGKNVGFDLPTR